MVSPGDELVRQGRRDATTRKRRSHSALEHVRAHGWEVRARPITRRLRASIGGLMSRERRAVSAALSCAIVRGLALTALSASIALGQGTRMVSGVVTDTDNRPVAKVILELAGVRSVTTDDSGRFRLQIPHQERVAIDVRRVGFRPSRFGLKAGGDTNVSVMML